MTPQASRRPRSNPPRAEARHAPHASRARATGHHRDGRARRACGRAHLGPPAAARGDARHHVPRHAGRHPLPRVDAGGDRATHRAAGRGSARDALRDRGDPCQRAVGPGPVRDPVRLGPRRQRGRLRRAHQARLDPRAAAGRRGPDADVRLQRVRPGDRHHPHLGRPRPHRPVRHAGEVPAATAAADRRRGARRAGGRAAARGARAGGPEPARGVRGRRAQPARAARSQQFLGQRRRDHRERRAVHRAADRRVRRPAGRPRHRDLPGRSRRRRRRRRAGRARAHGRAPHGRPPGGRHRRLQDHAGQRRRRRGPRHRSRERGAQDPAAAGHPDPGRREPGRQHPRSRCANCATPASSAPC